MAKTTQEPVIRGMYHVPLPPEQPMVWTAQEGRHLPAGQFRMNSGHYWVLLYCFTPTHIRLETRPDAWNAYPEPGAWLIPPYTDYTTRTQGEVHHAWATLQSLVLSPLHAMLQNRSGLLRFEDPDGQLARQLLALVGAAEARKTEAFWAMQYALRPLLRSLERSTHLREGVYRVTPTGSGTVVETLIPGVVAYLQNNMSRRISTAELATHLRMSVSTVSHAYHKVTGETPMQTLRRLRLHQLKTRLVEGWSLEAAAEEVGFCDAHHASREFKRVERQTPTAFLRSLRHMAA